MAKRYRPVLREQGFLLPPDMRDWLPAGHPVHLVITVVENHLDTRAVHAATRRAGGAGAAGFDPDMLTALLIWAYANRVTSSRRIEGLCRTDVAFRLICGGGPPPDHVTIARFRARLGPAAADLFDQVLIVCARLGMGRLGLVALDGMKIAASASAKANRTEQALRELAEQIAAEHAATDAAEDDLFGPGRRGDELDPELADPRTRSERIAAALADLEADREAAQAGRDAQASDYLAKVTAGPPGPGSRPAAADVAAAQLLLDQALAAQQAKVEDYQRRQAAKIAATGTGLRQRPPAPGGGKQVNRAAAGLDRARQRAAGRERKTAQQEKDRRGPGPVRNTTDPHSRLMPTRAGFIQGYNTQNLASSDGLILATALTTSPVDTPWLAPMLTAAGRAAALIAAHRADGGEPVGLLLADAGYLSEHNLTAPGPDRLIATGKNRSLRHAAQHPRRSGGTARGPAVLAMAARLTTPQATAAYRHRGHIAETPHGHIKHNLGFRQLSVRGLPRATAEWMLTCTVHNLFKAITSGHLTNATLAALT